MPDAAKPSSTRAPTNPGNQPAASGGPPRTQSNPGSMKALSAARSAPLRMAEEPKTAVHARLKEGAADTALNGVSLLRETWSDFRKADRYFKYKAGIIAAWLALSLTAVVVAWPDDVSAADDNALGAMLIAEPSRSEYMIRNDGNASWVNVTVRVNNRFTMAVPGVGPGESIVFTPKQLSDADGEPAPNDLRVMDIVVKTVDDDVELMRRGKIRD